MMESEEKMREYDTMFSPPMDIYETEGEVVIELELPEVDISNVRIVQEGNRITIEGVKGYNVGNKKVRFLRMERYCGYFKRVVDLPFSPRQEDIKAVMGKGVLKIRIAKKKRIIEVEGEKDE